MKLLPISYFNLYRGPLLLLVLIAGLPLCARGSYSYLLPLIQLCGIYAIIVTGLTLLIGFTGQVSLGHAGFYGLGAYAAGVAATAFHAPIWAAALAALAAGGLLAFLSGVVILRLQGHYLALATLCLGVIIAEVITKLPITGGEAGLYDLPHLTVGNLPPDNPLVKVYLIWTVTLLVVLWAVHLTESPVGRALKAIHGDEDAALSLGIDVFAVKLKIFIASGILAALAGVLYAFVYTPSYLGPEEFSLMFSVTLLTMVVVGGMGNVWGGLTGAVVLIGLREVITTLGEHLHITDTAKYEQLVFGSMLVLVLIFARGGLAPGLRSGLDRLARVRR